MRSSKTIIACVAALVIVFSVQSAMTQNQKLSADPFVGTWKLNVAKSRYNLRKPQKGEILKIDTQPYGLKYVVDGIDAEGKKIHFEFSPKYDGKYYSVAGTVASGSAMALKKIDTNIHEMVLKVGGKEVQRRRDVISKDGKTLTRTVTATNTQERDAKDVIVFDRQ